MTDRSDRRRTSGSRGWLTSDRIALAAFAVSLLLLAYGVGVATAMFQLPPYGLFARAQRAIGALQKVERNKEPPHFIRYLAPGDTARIVRAAAAPDANLILMTGGFYYRTDICPKVGCIAWIMTRDGKVLHRWSYDPKALFGEGDFKGFSGFPGAFNVFVQGADMDRDGNLVVTFQGRNVFPYEVGIAKFDKDGRLLWKRINRAHHWPTTGPDGRIYTPVARIVPPGDNIAGMPRPSNCRAGRVDDEGVAVLDPAGRTLATFWMSEVVRASDRKALTYTVRDDCDPFHVNGIDLVNDAAAKELRTLGIADAKPGDLAVSLRSSSTLVFMDGATGRIKHIVYGPMVDQHSPAALPDGEFLIFDDIGASTASAKGVVGRSRILKIGIAPQRYEQVFPRPGGEDLGFFSESEGAVNASPDGKRALIAETLGGRVIEFDLATGAPLWVYREVDPISDYLAATGEDRSDKLALLQTQGAAYVTRADFDRIFAGAR